MDIIEKAKSVAAGTGQKVSSLLTWMALQVARREASKAPVLIGPGKSSVLTLHRNLPYRKKYDARPFSHPRREAAAKRQLEERGTGYLGMHPGESARYYKRLGRIAVFASPEAML